MKNLLLEIRLEVEFWMMIFYMFLATGFDSDGVKSLIKDKKLMKDVQRVVKTSKTKDEYWEKIFVLFPEVKEYHLDLQKLNEKLLNEDPTEK